ncbi:hypothetical protein CNMCM6936_002143 [Aspergillus lentulus]|nr:hypothetical protein CNMCM6936_002143 [Aspergillus lentulus]KAF4172575.1 hypothetical protein CNMCM8060_001326 [Aspergillus lentulus]KAF4180097.1 hypothetical protein CNMCM7927_001434 [Aspergillus lentulus]KAF4191996.1 hypothetical protein CNMCM8694_001022 [Aspergillus lentulus]GFF93091.1 hypothetical protein IFM47457_09410 [Aspergillus lentulus]
MDSPILSSPTKILHPLSPERMNQQQTIPSSPSRQSDILDIQQRKKTRGMSDVQARVAYLNNLSRGNSPANTPQPSTSSGTSAALQRALLGREEAESALASVSAQLSEAQSRERRISERLESLLEELQAAKERQAHERSVFEKEIRKARKEAFRAGSALVKLQEELKHARSETRGLKEEVLCERAAKEQAKQEAFERAYALAGLTEELEVLKGRLRNVEANRRSDSLEARAKEMGDENIGRLSLAEGDLAFMLTPAPRRPKRPAEDSTHSPLVESADQTTAQDTPPKRLRLSDVTPRQGDQNTLSTNTQQEIIDDLEESLKHERKMRLDAEDMIEFLRMECEFKRCSCRLAEEEEQAHHVHAPTREDVVANDEVQNIIKEDRHDIRGPEAQHHSHFDNPLQWSGSTQQARPQEQPEELLITFSPVTGTFKSVPSPVRSPPKQPQGTAISGLESSISHGNLSAEQLLISPFEERHINRHEPSFEPMVQVKEEDSVQPFAPGLQPSPARIRVPWDSPSPRYSIEDNHNASTESDGALAPHSVPLPGTSIDREQALAQIRARRGKTSTMKRSVSANEATLRSGGGCVTPGRGAQKIRGVQNSSVRTDGDKAVRRDLSAPVRMFRR